MIDLIIGGIPIPLLSSISLSQEYENLAATMQYRMGDGSLELQTAWAGNHKLRTTISGRGQIPLGLSGLNLPQTGMTISCIKRRGITSLTNTILLPAARRTDAGAEPIGLALMDNRWQRVNVTIDGDQATLDQVASAKQYQIEYYPEFAAFVRAPIERKDARGSTYSWTINAEEI